MSIATVRNIQKSDARRVWEIRNHPEVRKFSGSQDVISFENHSTWFSKKYFTEQDNHCYVLCDEHAQVIGYCRFDADADGYLVSIAIDPAFHGKGLGTYILQTALHQLQTQKPIYADVNKNNAPSFSLFKKFHFIIEKEDAHTYYMKYIEKKTKTIFIAITRSFITRNILRSGTLTLLKKAGYRVVIFFDAPTIPQYIRDEFEDSMITVIPLKIHVSRMHVLYIMLNRYLVFTKNTKTYFYFGMTSKDRRLYREGDRPKRPFVRTWIRYTLARILSRFRVLKILFRYVDEHFFKERNAEIQKYFNTYKPDLVFSTSVLSGLDVALMKEAKRRHVPTVALPKTWDNLTNLYYRFVPDHFVVYNSRTEEAAHRVQHIPKERIHIVGMPHFDWYAKKDVIIAREEHLKSKGLDPALPVLFYGSSGIWSTSDNKLATLLYTWIQNNELAKPCQLLVRPHFSNCKDDTFKNFKGKPGIAVDTYRITDFLIDSWDQSVEETIDFTNSVYHCAIMINLASSLALDAACCDRPIINPSFGCSYIGGKDVTEEHHYGTDHYGWVLETQATAVAHSEKELKDHINTYLCHPETKSAERETLRKELCYKVDGKSSERLVTVLQNVLEKKYV